MDKEAILKKNGIWKPQDHDDDSYRDLYRSIHAAMDEYSAPFKKALQGMIQMYELDYPTTVHYMFRPDYLYAVEVMKGEGEPPNNYWKQLAEACERMYNALVTGNFNDFAKYSEEWKKLKSQSLTEQAFSHSSGNQTLGSTDIKM